MAVSSTQDLPLPRARLLDLLGRFEGTPVVLWGDFVVDRFLLGSPKRISREAPVLILSCESEVVVPGGGGNALMNLASLGARPTAIGAVGDDPAGTLLVRIFADAGIETSGIEIVPDYETPAKTRVLAGFPHGVKQQVVRFDREHPLPDAEGVRARLAGRARGPLSEARACVLSDYGYGAITPAAVPVVATSLGDRGKITVDSRFRVAEYRGASAATPNEEEAARASGLPLDRDEDGALAKGGEALRSSLQAEALLVTRGSRGSALFEAGRPPILVPCHGGNQVADVTGAGDTVIATFTLALAAGGSYLEAAVLASIAGGIVVMKSGTATVTREEIAHGLAVEPWMVG
jgi:rfaE bifunctional protein kinase chain/domain